MAKQVLGCIGYSKVGRDIALISDEWAKHLDADLHLLHIRNPSPYAPESSGKLATFIEELDLHTTPHLHTPLGKPEHLIPKMAERLQADLIITAAHSHTAIGRMLAGSVSNAIVHHAHCPVLVVRRPEPPPGGGILVPIDFTDINARVIQLADTRAHDYGCPLHFIHVAPDPASFVGWTGTPMIDPITPAPEAREMQTAMATEQIEQLIRRVGVTANYDITIAFGKPYEEILRVQQEKEASLIMLAAHSHNALERLLLGGNTRHLLNSVPCSLYIHKEAERAKDTAVIPDVSRLMFTPL